MKGRGRYFGYVTSSARQNMKSPLFLIVMCAVTMCMTLPDLAHSRARGGHGGGFHGGGSHWGGGRSPGLSGGQSGSFSIGKGRSPSNFSASRPYNLSSRSGYAGFRPNNLGLSPAYSGYRPHGPAYRPYAHGYRPYWKPSYYSHYRPYRPWRPYWGPYYYPWWSGSFWWGWPLWWYPPYYPYSVPYGYYYGYYTGFAAGIQGSDTLLQNGETVTPPLAYPDQSMSSEGNATIPKGSRDCNEAPVGESPPGRWVEVPGQWVGGKWVPSHRVWVPINP